VLRGKYLKFRFRDGFAHVLNSGFFFNYHGFTIVRFRLCMSMEWKNEYVDGLFITQLLKACLSTVRVG
jgi:hypothetical protein